MAWAPTPRLPRGAEELQRRSARVGWTSRAAAEVWEPRLDAIRHAWMELELAAAGRGELGATVLAAKHVDAGGLLERAADHGLEPLEASYALLRAADVDIEVALADPRQALLYELVVSRGGPAAAPAGEALDADALVEVYGFPPCCAAAFDPAGPQDAALQLAAGTAASDGLLAADGPVGGNVLFHAVGVGAVGHVPCGFACAATAEAGAARLEAGRKAGFGEAMGWLDELLQWPVAYSAVNGLAEIKTPVFRVTAPTDAVGHDVVIQRRGTRYPAEAAKGLGFPFLLPNADYQEAYARRRSIAEVTPIELDDVADLDPGRDGFASPFARRARLSSVVWEHAGAMRRVEGPAVDLRCGDGLLLELLQNEHAKLEPWGFDPDAARIDRAAARLPGHAANLQVADWLTDDPLGRVPARAAVTVLDPEPLVGLGDARRDLVSRLVERSDRVVAYANDRALAAHGSFAELAAAAGLDLAAEPGRHHISGVVRSAR